MRNIAQKYTASNGRAHWIAAQAEPKDYRVLNIPWFPELESNVGVTLLVDS